MSKPHLTRKSSKRGPKYLQNGYASASEQSRSLAARLSWDIRVLRQFTDYYEKKVQSQSLSLSKEDADILEYSTAYLLGLCTKITAIAERIQSKNRFHETLNKALWWHREEEVRELEAELFEWTTRLDLRLVGLPKELKTVINLDDEDQSSKSVPNFTASVHIQRIRTITEKASKLSNDAIFKSGNDVARENHIPNDTQRFKIFTDAHGSQCLIERRFHECVKDSDAWHELKEGLTKLASALHHLDGTTVSLLHCNYIFSDTRDARQLSFSFINSLPFQIDTTTHHAATAAAAAPMTLHDAITRTQGTVRLPPMHSLTSRFNIALAITTSIFFLHSVGFLHHALTSRNVLLLHRKSKNPQNRFPYELGTPFLVGFETVKEVHTTSDGLPHADPDLVYQHPDRHPSPSSFPSPSSSHPSNTRPKYTEIHDIHSLGLLLLELSIWKPLSRYEKDLLSPSKRDAKLNELLGLVDVAMGKRFRKVVEWCVGLETGEMVDSLRVVRNVLEPLEEMRGVLS